MERIIDAQEAVDIAVSSAYRFRKELNDEAVIIPKLIRASLAFFVFLERENRIDFEDLESSRDVICDIMLKYMKERCE